MAVNAHRTLRTAHSLASLTQCTKLYHLFIKEILRKNAKKDELNQNVLCTGQKTMNRADSR